MIVDASVAVKWFTDEPGSDRARALLGDADLLLAPSLIIAEVGSTFWKLARRGEADPSLIAPILRASTEAFSQLVPIEHLAQPAAALAIELDYPLYDCLYLALAQERGDTLITADQRLANAVTGTELQQRTVLL